DVEPAQFGDALVEDRLQRDDVADVDFRSDATPPGLLDELRGLFEILRCRHGIADRREVLAPVDGDDVGAFLGQSNRVAAALAPACAGDEGDLLMYASH